MLRLLFDRSLFLCGKTRIGCAVSKNLRRQKRYDAVGKMRSESGRMQKINSKRINGENRNAGGRLPVRFSGFLFYAEVLA